MKEIMYQVFDFTFVNNNNYNSLERTRLPMQEMKEKRIQSLGQEDPPEKDMTTRSGVLSCLENPMDRGGWRAIVHGVTKSQIRLKHLSMNFLLICIINYLLTMHFNPEINARKYFY